LFPSAVVERAQTSFEDALDRARPMANTLVEKLGDTIDAKAAGGAEACC
jgi:hypothetical protein